MLAQRERDTCCPYCGDPVAKSRDHVPPKAWFPPPLPKMITVKCCEACNHAASRDDESFRNLLAVDVGINSIHTRRFFDLRAKRGILNNRKVLRDILTAPQLYVRKPGSQFAKMSVITFERELYTRVGSRLVKGLYRHETGSTLRADTPIDVWHVDVPDPFERLFSFGKFSSLGPAFTYGYVEADRSSQTTVWFFAFYDRHFMVVWTGNLEGLRDMDFEPATP